jgi:peptide/nickel transport system permease protein
LRKLLIRNLAGAIPLILLVATVSFLLVQMTPGSPAEVILGTSATPDEIARVNAELGLDRPIIEQYAGYIADLARGNMGKSLISGQPVSKLVGSRLPVTMSIALLAALFSTLIGVLLGVAAAVRSGPIDRAVTTLSGVGLALPNFWVGALLVFGFSLTWKWLPATGYISLGESVIGWGKHLLLPVVTLTIAQLAAITRQTRSAVLLEAGKDYVRSLRAAGVSERSILWRHILRNASIPVATTLGLQFVAVLGGAVVIEFYFAVPGIGALIVASAQSHDIPVIQGIVVMSAVIVLAVNLLIDLIVGLLNPKVRRA